jgi:hypothetical protein
MFELASAYRREGMAGYVRLQQREFELEQGQGYGAVRHQRFVGTGYFDEVATIVSGGTACTTAMKGSTEEAQFAGGTRPAQIMTVNDVVPITLGDPMQADQAGADEAADEPVASR